MVWTLIEIPTHSDLVFTIPTAILRIETCFMRQPDFWFIFGMVGKRTETVISIESNASSAIPLNFIFLVKNLNLRKIILLIIIFLTLHNRTVGPDSFPQRLFPIAHWVITLRPLILRVIITSHSVQIQFTWHLFILLLQLINLIHQLFPFLLQITNLRLKILYFVVEW